MESPTCSIKRKEGGPGLHDEAARLAFPYRVRAGRPNMEAGNLLGINTAHNELVASHFTG